MELIKVMVVKVKREKLKTKGFLILFITDRDVL